MRRFERLPPQVLRDDARREMSRATVLGATRARGYAREKLKLGAGCTFLFPLLRSGKRGRRVGGIRCWQGAAVGTHGGGVQDLKNHCSLPIFYSPAPGLDLLQRFTLE